MILYYKKKIGQFNIFNKNNKIMFFIKLYLLFLFLNNLSIKNNYSINNLKKNKIQKENYIDINNEFSLFENNIDFSNYSTDIKIIALYLPQFHSFKENDNWWGKNFTEWTNVKKSKPLYEGHHQPRKPGDDKNYLGYYYLTKPEIFKKQINLAKSHGIYGFGFYYYWFSGKRLLEKPLDIYLNNKDLDFPFLLIWANENWTRNWNGKNKNILIKQQYKEKDPENFIKDIKKYIIDFRYIKIKRKSIIGIYEPKKISNLSLTIHIWRKKAKELEIGELFIIVCLNLYNINTFKNMGLFDAAYDFPPRNIINYKYKSKINHLYSTLIYKNINYFNISNEFPVFRGSMVEWDNSPRKGKYATIFKGYSPQKFYILNKILIQWTKINYNKDNSYIFINAWNEWGEGSYLEPDEKYGYASINSLSKALFNLSYFNNYNITNISKDYRIVIQAHIYSEGFINEIIKKINYIPLKYDLYISTTSLNNKENIENYIKKNLKYNRYEIINVENKGKDILPFLKQLKLIFKNYKYICHIYTKELKDISNVPLINYLYDNLLGNKNIILEIISNFENIEKLGFIYPEVFHYTLLDYGKKINNVNNIVILAQ